MKVTICGLGHATHALVPLLCSKGHEVHVLTRRENGIADRKKLDITTNTGLSGSCTISSDPATIKYSDVIVMPVPSDTYDSYLEKMAPHIQLGQSLVITPGQGRFYRYAQKHIDGYTLANINISYVSPMPVNCRTVEEGKSVDVKAYKKNFFVTCEGNYIDLELIRDLFDAKNITYQKGGSTLANLMPINPVIHTARLYNLFKDTDVIRENPLFYEQMSESDIELMHTIQRELGRIGCAYKVVIPDLFEFLAKFVYETDYSNMHEFFTQYSAYKGFRSPVKPVRFGYSLDKSSRYIGEDVELGLKVYQEYARDRDVKTPVIDMIVDRLLSL